MPPHSIEAEQSVLGSVILNPFLLDEVGQIIRAEDFYRPGHGQIFEAVTELREMGHEIDLISVASKLEDRKALEAVGGRGYLLELSGVVPSSTNATRYAKIVRERALYRRLVQIGSEISTLGYESSGNIEDDLGQATSLVMGVSIAGQKQALPVATVWDQLLKELRSGPANYISPPHLPKVHARPGALVVLAAGTSVGKTAVALDWTDAWAGTMQTWTAFLEYEMSEVSLVSRLASKHSGISMVRMEEGLSEAELALVESAGERVRRHRLLVEAVTSDVGALFAKIRHAASKGCSVVVVDHLGLIPFRVPRGMNHAKAVGTEVTNKLKRLANDLGIVIVLLCQVNREGQKRIGPNPWVTKNDLRDSGEIEQDADIIIGLNRISREDDEALFLRVCDDIGIDPYEVDTDIMRYGVLKNRNGPLFHKYLGFAGESMSFYDLFAPRSLAPRAEPEPEVQPPPAEQISMMAPGEE